MPGVPMLREPFSKTCGSLDKQRCGAKANTVIIKLDPKKSV